MRAALPALDAHQSSQVFRLLLDVLARPGTRARLPLQPDMSPALLVPLALADVDVTLAVLDEPRAAREWEVALGRATDARVGDLAHSDIVVALQPPSVDELRRLKRGTSLAPEEGARLVLACRSLSDGDSPAELVLELGGPGVPGKRRLGIDGLSGGVINALADLNTAFPMGVDTFLVAQDGTLAGLPRTTQISLEREVAWATPR